LAVMNWELGLVILKENIIVKGKLTNKEKILAYVRNMK